MGFVKFLSGLPGTFIDYAYYEKISQLFDVNERMLNNVW